MGDNVHSHPPRLYKDRSNLEDCSNSRSSEIGSSSVNERRNSSLEFLQNECCAVPSPSLVDSTSCQNSVFTTASSTSTSTFGRYPLHSSRFSLAITSSSSDTSQSESYSSESFSVHSPSTSSSSTSTSSYSSTLHSSPFSPQQAISPLRAPDKPLKRTENDVPIPFQKTNKIVRFSLAPRAEIIPNSPSASELRTPRLPPNSAPAIKQHAPTQPRFCKAQTLNQNFFRKLHTAEGPFDAYWGRNQCCHCASKHGNCCQQGQRRRDSTQARIPVTICHQDPITPNNAIPQVKEESCSDFSPRKRRFVIADTRRTFCRCFPLQVSAIFSASFFLLIGSMGILSSVRTAGFPDLATVTTLLTSIFQLIVACFGSFAFLARKRWGAYILFIGAQVWVSECVVGVLTSWASWICLLLGVGTEEVWEPNRIEILEMMTTTLSFFLIPLVVWKLFSPSLKSLARVLKVGGTGWEMMNYLDVMRQVRMEAQRRAAEPHSDKNPELIISRRVSLISALKRGWEGITSVFLTEECPFPDTQSSTLSTKTTAADEH